MCLTGGRLYTSCLDKARQSAVLITTLNSGSSGTLIKFKDSFYVLSLGHCLLLPDDSRDDLFVRHPFTLKLASTDTPLDWDFLYYRKDYDTSGTKPVGEPAMFHVALNSDSAEAQCAAEVDLVTKPVGSKVTAWGFRGRGRAHFVKATIVEEVMTTLEKHYLATTGDSDHGVSGSGVFVGDKVVAVIQGFCFAASHHSGASIDPQRHL